MQHFMIASGPCTTNCYLVACASTGSAVVIDPAPGSYHWLQTQVQKERWHLEGIWLTHSHWDHFADAHLLQQLETMPSLLLAVHRLDAENVLHPGKDGLPLYIPISPARVDRLLEDEERLLLGELSFQVLHTPGHSPGGVCFYEANQHILFSGDTLFKGTIGNLTFPTCSPDLMWTSLARLAKLPSHTKVYPGHGPSTTIGAESWLSDAKRRFSRS